MSYLPAILAVAACYLLPGLFNVFALRYAHRGWWRHPALRLVCFLVPPLGLAMCFWWLFSFENWGSWASCLGISAFGVMLLQIAVAAALLITVLATWTGRRLAARRRARNGGETAQAKVDLLRRRVWQGSLAALPLLAAGTSVAGVATAAGDVKVKLLPLRIATLPRRLHGFRILHISDLHLSGFVRPATVAGILDRARTLAPDLVVITGDSADDPRLLPEALEMIVAFAAPREAFAVMGNHEYSHGISRARDIFTRGRVVLLEDRSEPLTFDGVKLQLAGIDDLVGGERGERRTPFFRRRIATALADVPEADFRILLSHRSDAFDEAARQGVDLTLAGHTHGGQVGLAGRSLLRMSRLYPYPWGHYRIGDSHLYTSAGAGHWLPFRLGCPAEAPVIELRCDG